MTAAPYVGSIYLLFFLSGATALVYQVVWVRLLTLVFGGSHHAVTAVLAVFMAGLALGGYAMGRLADRIARPLRLYGLLELGIAATAALFMGLMTAYPWLYAAVARGRDDQPLYLLGVRVLFSLAALIGPTTLMGATLPVLSRFVSGGPDRLRRSLSLLYGLNTLGAVLGAFLAGFALLPRLSVSTTLWLAIAVSAAIGVVSLLLAARLPAAEWAAALRAEPMAPAEDRLDPLPGRLVLWGIAISGFCALGYEVLWTRVLTIALGASVYSFTVMLVAFLTGIALGSKAYGLLGGRARQDGAPPTRAIAGFGAVQVVIGVSAFLVTVLLRDVPVNAIRLRELFPPALGAFALRTWSNLTLAFLYMAVPAFFMGIAFPLAGQVHARFRRAVGRAVGEVLAYNTVGAIAGAAVSGLVLIRLFGIERSLQMRTALNAGVGLVVRASLTRRRQVTAVAAALPLGLLVLLAARPDVLRFWDTAYFAIFRSNDPEAFATPALVREAIENTDVLYYAEGLDSIVSVIRVKGAEQAFLTNGRVEASSHLQAQQCQLTLGHLPMLLAPDPRRVLVVGLGSGMTAGAVSVHPSVERVTLVEIEPKVLGVARLFAAYNHRVLDDPKLRIVFNDGRNFLLTTADRFDVITADPIHPWFRGAASLYTAEYFKLAAEHLTPGGVIAQWLPIYELSPQDVRSVVRTFRQQFRYTLLWLTHYDAQLIGSNAPLVLDEAALARRLAVPAVAADLQRVMMGSPADLLSYFVMGTEGMTRFGASGIVNTDGWLYLEFSAPFSIATASVMADNVRALTAQRESILPYLAPAPTPAGREEQRQWAELQLQAAAVGDLALALFLGEGSADPRFGRALVQLDQRYPWYAPGRFLRREHDIRVALSPRPLRGAPFTLLDERGQPTVVEIFAVLVPISRTRAAVMFVDNRARVVYGQRYVDDYVDGQAVTRLVDDVMAGMRAAYQKEAEVSRARGPAPPSAARTLPKIRAAIEERLRSATPAP